jgi:DNA-binding MarR family transcriptional regulator
MKNSPHGSSATTAPEASPEALAWALFMAAEKLSGRVEAALQEVGLSWAKYELLRQLAQRSEPLPFSELASGQRCAASNITQLVDRLEIDGLVRRLDDPSDRRSKRAALTLLGTEKQQTGAKQIAIVQAEFASALSDDDRAALARGLGAALVAHDFLSGISR